MRGLTYGLGHWRCAMWRIEYGSRDLQLERRGRHEVR
jgi:hypothetical protein